MPAPIQELNPLKLKKYLHRGRDFDHEVTISLYFGVWLVSRNRDQYVFQQQDLRVGGTY